MSWIDKLERKFGRYAIKGLMTYITGITGFVFCVGFFDQTGIFADKIALIPSLVLKGEIWRLFTYIFIPPTNSLIWIIFILQLYYMIGITLEHEWGSFRFNLYYFLGMLGTTIAAFITNGYGTSVYLNLSLFLAFAKIYPDYEFLLFFVLPVKVKYLAYLDWFFIIVSVITLPLSFKIAAIMSVINYFVFFGKDIITNTATRGKSRQRKAQFQKKYNSVRKTYTHKCSICGITDVDNPEMEFRYCSKCEGIRCYCMEHIADHQHVQKKEETKVIEFPHSEKK